MHVWWECYNSAGDTTFWLNSWWVYWPVWILSSGIIPFLKLPERNIFTAFCYFYNSIDFSSQHTFWILIWIFFNHLHRTSTDDRSDFWNRHMSNLVVIFWFNTENSFQWVQICLVLVQWFSTLPFSHFLKKINNRHLFTNIVASIWKINKNNPNTLYRSLGEFSYQQSVLENGQDKLLIT